MNPRHHPFIHTINRQVQQCTLLSIKTGGCPEDCGYCSQSKSHTSAFVKPTPLMSTAEVCMQPYPDECCEQVGLQSRVYLALEF